MFVSRDQSWSWSLSLLIMYVTRRSLCPAALQCGWWEWLVKPHYTNQGTALSSPNITEDARHQDVFHEAVPPACCSVPDWPLRLAPAPAADHPGAGRGGGEEQPLAQGQAGAGGRVGDIPGQVIGYIRVGNKLSRSLKFHNRREVL